MAVFLLGCIAGGLGLNLGHVWADWLRWSVAEPVPQAAAPRAPALGLRAEQRDQIQAILTEGEQQLARLQAAACPELHGLWSRAQTRIQRVLDARQQPDLGAKLPED
ncbi:MAG TPA: hypothetical protein VMG58_15600 [Candidatus Sulfotelmatobacter sp.]|nr:hypothetical protein [Candidatus Sulfotelmatobacter sp.]